MIEVPIIYEIVKEAEAYGQKVLEVGNVLSHYFHVNHDIMDKYEKAKGVINEDVINFRLSKKYDLIISISTLKHVGWDEYPKDPTKVLVAIENLKRCLSSNGRMVFTLPLGYNPHVDSYIKNDAIHFD
jgi:SAM-dependent methyltransferase